MKSSVSYPSYMTHADHPFLSRDPLQAFVANEKALGFYRHTGFEIDKTCPSKHGQPECKYRLMSLYV